eukprot:TRINITY_DN30734_c0_g1_i1.p1 TRINITY_DN30734_c0_g1~~TRINITY_DN30734_c0_g1_i1.p1  ORF type:complete len:333 (+),score=54.39 TRINITY_DN30734_c0_g1_i1:40-999(+)
MDWQRPATAAPHVNKYWFSDEEAKNEINDDECTSCASNDFVNSRYREEYVPKAPNCAAISRPPATHPKAKNNPDQYLSMSQMLYTKHDVSPYKRKIYMPVSGGNFFGETTNRADYVHHNVTRENTKYRRPKVVDKPIPCNGTSTSRSDYVRWDTKPQRAPNLTLKQSIGIGLPFTASSQYRDEFLHFSTPPLSQYKVSKHAMPEFNQAAPGHFESTSREAYRGLGVSKTDCIINKQIIARQQQAAAMSVCMGSVKRKKKGICKKNRSQPPVPDITNVSLKFNTTVGSGTDDLVEFRPPDHLSRQQPARWRHPKTLPSTT